MNMVYVPLLAGDSGGGFGGQSGNGLLSFLGAILVMAGVLYLAYKSTKLIGKKYGNQSLENGSHLEVLERINMGTDRQLAIVRLRDGQVLLLGITAHHIETLEKLDPAAFEDIPPKGQAQETEGFSNILKDTLAGLNKGKKDAE